MTVRTKSLGLVNVGTGDTVLYTCPAGFRTIFKDGRAFCVAGAGSQGAFYVARAGVNATVLGSGPVGPGDQLTVSGAEVVLEAGDELHFLSFPGTWQVIASGAELAL